jgi:hypothetical protein
MLDLHCARLNLAPVHNRRIRPRPIARKRSTELAACSTLGGHGVVKAGGFPTAGGVATMRTGRWFASAAAPALVALILPWMAGGLLTGRALADQVTWTVPWLPGSEIVIRPPHMHSAVQPVWRAGWPFTITLVAPGVHGELVAGTHGAGVNTPLAAAVAAATAGLDGVEHIPNVGMLTVGANA